VLAGERLANGSALNRRISKRNRVDAAKRRLDCGGGRLRGRGVGMVDPALLAAAT
jgi:hypothetical protein